MIWPNSALEQVVAEVLLIGLDIRIYCVAGLFRQLELHRMSGFALSDSGTIGGQPAR